jgi:predicted TIM-barrel fold metal-dependent hydrolase
MSISRRRFLQGIGATSVALGRAWDCRATLMKDADKITRKYVDLHIHMNPWSDEGFSFQQVLEWMREHDVFKCVVQGGLWMSHDKKRSEGYEHAVNGFREHKGLMLPFCCIPTEAMTSNRLARDVLSQLTADGAVGYGEHKPGDYAVDDPMFVRLYKACSELELPVLFHMDRKHNHDEIGLPRLTKLLKTMPECTFIGHANGWWAHISGEVLDEDRSSYPKRKVQPNGAVDRLLSDYPNMYGDLSAKSGANAISRDKEFGREFLIRNADKLMFGTDTFRRDHKLPHFELFESLDLPADVKRKIYRDNALRLLKIGQ